MDPEIKELLEKNLAVSNEILSTSKYIKNYVIWSQVMGVIKIILIVVPLVLGGLYLAPILKNALEQYQNLLNLTPGSQVDTDNLQEMLKNKNIDIDSF